MTSQQDDRPFRALFSEQAGQDRRQAPAFEDTLRHARGRPPIAVARLALAAGLVLAAGTLFSLAYRSVTRPPVEPQAALPNMLEALDNTSLAQWQSPTAFLLDWPSAPAQPDSEPAPDQYQNRSETRHSNG